jgi:hypothetical protein
VGVGVGLRVGVGVGVGVGLGLGDAEVGIGVDVGVCPGVGGFVGAGVADGEVFGVVVVLALGVARLLDAAGSGVGEVFLVGTGSGEVEVAVGVPGEGLGWADADRLGCGEDVLGCGEADWLGRGDAVVLCLRGVGEAVLASGDAELVSVRNAPACPFACPWVRAGRAWTGPDRACTAPIPHPAATWCAPVPDRVPGGLPGMAVERAHGLAGLANAK